MFASVCNLFGRSLFVTVAAPLVLLGSLLNQVSIELEIQSVQNLRYAVEESSVAAGSEEEAARDVGEAALDQTEAELLEEEAKSLNAAENTAATAQEAQAEAGAELEAAEEERVSELSEQVESLASEVAENLPKLGGLDAAGEAAVDAVAATATGVAAPTVGADAVLAGVAGTVAVEGPKVVAAAEEEWALGSTELQAANDERLAVEKEVQAGALEGDVPVLQASALGAEEAAYGSFMTAAAYLTAATGAQLLALVMQVPVLAVFASQWLLDLRVNVRGKLDSIPEVKGDGHLWAVELFSQTALYGAIGASMLVPWANVVVMAAKFEEMGDEAVHELSALPSLIEKAVPILSRGETPKEFSSKESPKSRRLRQPLSRRLWDWQKTGAWMSKTVDDAEKEVKTIAKTGKQVVGDIEEDGIKVVGDIEEDGIKAVKALPNITKKAVKALPNITNEAGALLREGERSADKEVKEASDAAREGAIEVVKGLAFKPNTLTTTVAPAHLQPAPLPLSFQHFFSVAKSKLWHSLLYWCQPVVIELFLVSFAFVAFEITMGLGRHTMRYHRGQYHGKLGYLQAFSALCIDVWSSWVFGLGVLLAFWVFGILFSKELEFVALRMQAVPAHLAVPLLGSLCAALSLYYVVRSFGCLSEGPRKDVGSQVSPRGSEADTLLPGRPEEFHTSRSMEMSLMDEESGHSGEACGLLRSLISVLVAVFVTALAAIEGPIISAALGSSWKAAVMSSWSWRLLPWGEILPKVWGHKLTLMGLLALVAAGGCLIGCILSFLRRSEKKLSV